jgi:cyclic-di-GMP-binding protein
MNTKFKPVPVNPEFRIHFKLTQENLSNWLLSIAHPSSQEACEKIIYLLQLLNKTQLSAKERIQFLTLINDYLEQYIALVSTTCKDLSFPLSPREQEAIEMITWSYLVLAESFYFSTESATLSRDEEVFLLYMGLQAIGKAQLHIASVYATPCTNFWKLVYKIFAKAETSRLLYLEINETNLKHVTVNTLFGQIVMFQLCDSRQFRPIEMQKIFTFLAGVCKDLYFYKLKDVKFQTELLEVGYFQAVNKITYKFESLLEDLTPHLTKRSDLFILDLDKDEPPLISQGAIKSN